jgi:hypothetical protein
MFDGARPRFGWSNAGLVAARATATAGTFASFADRLAGAGAGAGAEAGGAAAVDVRALGLLRVTDATGSMAAGAVAAGAPSTGAGSAVEVGSAADACPAAGAGSGVGVEFFLATAEV